MAPKPRRLLCTICALILLTSSKAFSPTSRKSIQAKPIPITSRRDDTPLVQPSPTTSSSKSKLFAWPLAKDPKGMPPDYPLAASRIAVTIASTFFTWYAQQAPNAYTNVMASSAFTLICSMLFDKRLGQAAFCGTFAGMCSNMVMPTWQLTMMLGVVTSVFFETLIHYRNAFLGLGGRLGFTAFLATSAVTFVHGGPPTGLSFDKLSLSALTQGTILPMAIWHAIGSVATIVLREVSDDSAAADPVRASAVVGLMGALLLRDKSAALAVYGGSFVGMSLPSRLMRGLLPGKPKGAALPPPTVFKLLLSFAIAGALGGIVHGATIDWGFWPGGWGGKAGTCAFAGCLIYRALEKVVSTVKGGRTSYLAEA